MLRRLFQRLEAWFLAVTFAEAGEHQTARQYVPSQEKTSTVSATKPRGRARRVAAH